MNTVDLPEKPLSRRDLSALEGAFREGPFWKTAQQDQADHYAVPQGLVSDLSERLPYMEQLHTDLMESKEALLDSHDNLMGHKSVASLVRDLSSSAANNPDHKAEMVNELKHLMDSKQYGPAFKEFSDSFHDYVSQFSHYVNQASDTIESMSVSLEDKTSRVDDLKGFTRQLNQEVTPCIANLYSEDKNFLMSDQLSGAVALSETRMEAVLYQNKAQAKTNQPDIEGP